MSLTICLNLIKLPCKFDKIMVGNQSISEEFEKIIGIKLVRNRHKECLVLLIYKMHKNGGILGGVFDNFVK